MGAQVPLERLEFLSVLKADVQRLRYLQGQPCFRPARLHELPWLRSRRVASVHSLEHTALACHALSQ